jgi:hypothetical protein
MCGRLSTLPWSLWSLFRSRRSADVVVFPSAGRGGEGEEGDGTIVFLFRVVCVLLVVCGYHVLQFLPTGLGGEGRRRLDASTPKPSGFGLLLGDLRSEVLLALSHLLPARWSGKDS